MKPEEIIELAKKAGLVYQDSSGEALTPFQEWVDISPYIKEFAALHREALIASGELVPREMPESFAQWLESQIPPGTVISNPRWWAPKIYRALTHCRPCRRVSDE